VSTPLPATFDEQAQSWDCAVTGTGDYVVGLVVGRAGLGRYILDRARGRHDMAATLEAVRDLSAAWPGAYLKLVENKANGPAVVRLLYEELAGLVEVNPDGGKLVRARACQPQIESGHVYLPHPALAPWVQEFIDECAAFPNGTYDDQVDALTQLLIRWQGLTNAPPAKRTRW
jgi:predicted phage terminase large subunit-like protein